jgi:hypothetical protein
MTSELREAIVDMLDQLDRGSWRDDYGHDVRLNVTVIRLRGLVKETSGEE